MRCGLLNLLQRRGPPLRLGCAACGYYGDGPDSIAGFERLAGVRRLRWTIGVATCIEPVRAKRKKLPSAGNLTVALLPGLRMILAPLPARDFAFWRSAAGADAVKLPLGTDSCSVCDSE